MKKISIIIILLITLSACTEELKKETALNILKQEFNNDCLGNILLKTNTDKDSFKNEIKVLREAESNGYLTIVPKTFRHVQGNYTVYEGFPTKEANMLKSNQQYILGKTDIIEVVGISENKENNTATIRFLYKLIPTELYKLGTIYNNKCPVKNIEKEIEFVKFDTGWKIKKK